MTNAQKWVAVFLLLFVILLVLSKLTRKEEDTYTDIDESTYQETEPVSQNPIEVLIGKGNCRMCHGSDLAGSGSGPSLSNLKENWNKEDLISYLKDPSSFKDDSRIAKSKGKYRMAMPPTDKLTDEELNIFVDHLLE